MNRPRVIIADLDPSYVVPLQLRFIEEFFNKIDLEIITQRQCFEKVFLTPQTVDVLIVAEQLFNTDLLRHDIRNLFVLAESDVNNSNLKEVNYLARYSAVKAIFSEIVGKSYPAFNLGEDDKGQETQIVLITSAAGGVGKTTVALGVSASLAKSYKRVLYIDAEWMQTFSLYLNNPAPIKTSELYAKLITGNCDHLYEDIAAVIREEGFDYLPPFNAPILSLGLSYRIYSQIAEAAKKSKKYDYIIIDTESSYDEEKARLINISDRVIVVTRQTKTVVHKTNRLYESLSGTESDKYICICNDFDTNGENYLTNASEIMRFEVNDYIQRMSAIEKKTIDGLAKEKDIQRVAYLLI